MVEARDALDQSLIEIIPENPAHRDIIEHSEALKPKGVSIMYTKKHFQGKILSSTQPQADYANKKSWKQVAKPKITYHHKSKTSFEIRLPRQENTPGDANSGIWQDKPSLFTDTHTLKAGVGHNWSLDRLVRFESQRHETPANQTAIMITEVEEEVKEMPKLRPESPKPAKIDMNFSGEFRKFTGGIFSVKQRGLRGGMKPGALQGLSGQAGKPAGLVFASKKPPQANNEEVMKKIEEMKMQMEAKQFHVQKQAEKKTEKRPQSAIQAKPTGAAAPVVKGKENSSKEEGKDLKPVEPMAQPEELPKKPNEIVQSLEVMEPPLPKETIVRASSPPKERLSPDKAACFTAPDEPSKFDSKFHDSRKDILVPEDVKLSKLAEANVEPHLVDIPFHDLSKESLLTKDRFEQYRLPTVPVQNFPFHRYDQGDFETSPEKGVYIKYEAAQINQIHVSSGGQSHIDAPHGNLSKFSQEERGEPAITDSLMALPKASAINQSRNTAISQELRQSAFPKKKPQLQSRVNVLNGPKHEKDALLLKFEMEKHMREYNASKLSEKLKLEEENYAKKQRILGKLLGSQAGIPNESATNHSQASQKTLSDASKHLQPRKEEMPRQFEEEDPYLNTAYFAGTGVGDVEPKGELSIVKSKQLGRFVEESQAEFQETFGANRRKVEATELPDRDDGKYDPSQSIADSGLFKRSQDRPLERENRLRISRQPLPQASVKKSMIDEILKREDMQCSTDFRTAKFPGQSGQFQQMPAIRASDHCEEEKLSNHKVDHEEYLDEEILEDDGNNTLQRENPDLEDDADMLEYERSVTPQDNPFARDSGIIQPDFPTASFKVAPEPTVNRSLDRKGNRYSQDADADADGYGNDVTTLPQGEEELHGLREQDEMDGDDVVDRDGVADYNPAELPDTVEAESDGKYSRRKWGERSSNHDQPYEAEILGGLPQADHAEEPEEEVKENIGKKPALMVFDFGGDEGTNRDKKLRQFEEMRRRKQEELDKKREKRSQSRNEERAGGATPKQVLAPTPSKKDKSPEKETPLPNEYKKPPTAGVKTRPPLPKEASTGELPKRSATDARVQGESEGFGVPKATPPKPGPKSTISFAKPSNKALIKNALTNVCLAGAPNRREREPILATMDEIKSNDNFIIVFKGATGRQDFRALYTYDQVTGVARKVYGHLPSPAVIDPSMVEAYYRFDSGAKEFKVITANKAFSIAVDAVALQPAVLKRAASGVA